MKVYIFYTDSHKILLDDFFLPSIKDEYNAELDITKFEQKCPSGRLNSNGWIETMYFKIDTILKGINENINKQNNIFIHSDIDIQFFGNFIEDCKNIFSSSRTVTSKFSDFGQSPYINLLRAMSKDFDPKLKFLGTENHENAVQLQNALTSSLFGVVSRKFLW